ncbi:hypothetical protein CANARDRAFT_71600 [[Candida] arabinofermentans NRRL YB-2248]|uniref:Interferon-related developmental regulator N-terminal domain-containing protein n=1 Tax=[Candida] arabinofermentans NRRL YB-2248 TaxID=983967 RepID=A0A1E4SWH4_9ASCO|nr:hypothetical protein CANARDRAFT_71600 [[Candida] arabinofermentans NRRL YB-2248]
MSQLERELRSQSKRKQPSTSSRSNSRGSKTPNNETDTEDDFDNEMNEQLNFNRFDTLLISKMESAIQDNQEYGSADAALSPTKPSQGNQETRANSLLRSIITPISSRSPSTSTSTTTSPTAEKIKITNSTTVQEIISSLTTTTKSKLPTVTREFLFSQLYSHLTKILPSESFGIINDHDFENLVKLLATSRSDLEYVLALRSISAYVCSDLDEIATSVIEILFPVLLSKIQSATTTTQSSELDSSDINGQEDRHDEHNNDDVLPKISPEIVSSSIIAYASLMLLIFEDSSCYGLADQLPLLFSVVETYTSTGTSPTEQEETIIINALNGIGVIVTLLYKSGQDVNEVIEENLPSLVDLLENSSLSKRLLKSDGILIALLFELYDYTENYPSDDDELDEGEEGEYSPYTPYYQLQTILNSLIKDSSKRVSKKDKKESRSIFREVLKTVSFHTSSPKRQKELLLEQSDTGSSTLSSFKLNKSKALPIKSWFEYVRLIHLKYIYDSELSSQYVSSKELRNVLIKPDNNGNRSYADEFTSDAGNAIDGKEWKDRNTAANGIKKELKIKVARELKVRQQFGDLSLS